MKILRDLGAWLFLRGGGDDAALGRLAMSRVVPHPRSENPADRKKAVAVLAQVHANEYLQRMLSELMHDQKEFIAMKATAETLYVMRGTMNGIALVKHALDVAASEHELNSQPEKPFDRYEAI